MSWNLGNITCIIGECGVQEIERELVNKNKKGIKVIRSNFTSPPLKPKDILKIYRKMYDDVNDFWINYFFNVNEENPSEFERFKLEVLKIFFGKTELVIAENFLDTIEEQIKEKALRLLLKSVKIVNSKLVIFMSSTEYASICDTIYLAYGDVVEISRDGKLVHPYAETLKNYVSIGKGKLAVKEIGHPSKIGCAFHDYCPYVMPICRINKPELIGDERHKVACFLRR